MGLVVAGAMCAQADELNLRWDSPTSGPTPDGYRMYRGATCDTVTPLNALNAPITALTYTDTTIVRGQTYTYKAKSVKGTEESVNFSNCTTFTVPNPIQEPRSLTCTVTMTGLSGTYECVAQ